MSLHARGSLRLHPLFAVAVTPVRASLSLLVSLYVSLLAVCLFVRLECVYVCRFVSCISLCDTRVGALDPSVCSLSLFARLECVHVSLDSNVCMSLC